ncbi:type VII secretion integral membrane protein EccD [Pseudonocardia lutea]|uniref:Type VII secretion integral membrane protein EccD n=1 Tax=Pseudonocardia lutea TaxID=2172015 RepID=A0ABW1ICU4_9PSEU
MDAYRRVTVLAPACRLDVALPADLAIAELVPMVRELLGEPRPGAGRGPAPWRLDGAAGAPLPPGATLAQLGIHDGELLRIGPAVAPPPAPRFDDLPEALAAAVEAAAAGDDDRALPLAVLGAVTGASVLLGALRGSGLLVVAAGVVGGLGAVAGALVLSARARSTAAATGPRGWTGLVPALCALPPAAAVGWLLAPGSPTAATLGAALLLTLAAAAAQAVVRVLAPLLTAVLLVGSTTALACAVLLLTGGTAATAGAACALAAVLAAPALAGVLAAPLLPRVALRFAGLSAADAAEPPGRPADGASRPAGQADLARRHLAGLVLGTAAVTAGGAVLAATVPSRWGPLLAVALCAVLLLRARGFAEPLPVRALRLAGLLGGCGAAVAGTLAAPAAVRLLAALATLGALLAVLALHGRPSRFGPVGRRGVDLAELVLTALCVPLAAAALDLFALARGW